MTFKLVDIAHESQIVELAGKVSEVLSERPQPHVDLDLDETYIDAAKTVLAALSDRVAELPSGTLPLTEQQVETFLDFDPDFLDVAKDMLRNFIERTERIRKA
jgi:hypothetical protein